LQWRTKGCDYRRSQQEAYLYQLRGEAELDDADAHAPLYSFNQRFSKKIENHVAAISLHFMYYNFVRIHQTLRVTPAMAAGVTDRVWDVADILKLLEEKPQKLDRADRHSGTTCKGTENSLG
jgi:hypothetical protein